MNDEHQTLIDDCIARESRLDDWARGFIDSLQQQLAAGRALTKKQEDKLEEIWTQATQRG